MKKPFVAWSDLELNDAMKTKFAAALGILLLIAPCARAQGTITMANYGTYSSGQTWSDPIYNTDGATPLTSPYEVALYVGAAPNGVLLVPGSTTVLGPGGLFSGPTITVSGEPVGAVVFAQVYAWDSLAGSTWEQAGSHGTPIGECEPFVMTFGSASSPGTLYGMPSFSLAGGVPEPQTIVLFSLGGALLAGAAMRRRAPQGV
jgi:hypothetical protein